LYYTPQQHGASVTAIFDPDVVGPAAIQCFADLLDASEYLAWKRARAAAIVVQIYADEWALAAIEHGTSPFAYVGTQAGIAFLIAVVQGPAASSDIMPAIDQLCGVIGGIAVAGAVTIALAPLRRLLERWITRAVAESDG
jgi:hypothetical protein